jgi:DNA-binding MarR family transcriptional regulator
VAVDEIAALKSRIAELEVENASLLLSFERFDDLLGDANRHTDRLEAELARLRGNGGKIRTRMSETVAMMLDALKRAGPKGAEVKGFADMTTMGKSRAYYLVNRMAEDGLIRRVGHVEPVRYALIEDPSEAVADYYRKASEVIG